MSHWTCTLIQRRGIPGPDWFSIYGETEADSLEAQAIRLDVSGSMLPIPALSQDLERTFLSASFGTVKLDFQDPLGNLMAQVGPGGMFDHLGGYSGPWVVIEEVWGSNRATRFVGYIDETSLEWTESDGGQLQLSAYPVSAILQARNLADDPELLRPWPSTDGTDLGGFVANVGLGDATSESSKWASTRVTWKTWTSDILIMDFNAGSTFPSGYHYEFSPMPTPPSDTVVINGVTYVVLSHDQGVVVEHWDWVLGSYVLTSMEREVELHLYGDPANLTSVLNLGDTILWGEAIESRRSHYLLSEYVEAPAEGSDGQDWMNLDTVDALAPGDGLIILRRDSSTDQTRRTTETLKVADIDGERRVVHFDKPLTRAYGEDVLRIRRDNQNPVYVDALQMAARVVAPLPLDTTHYQAARTIRPVFQWLPMTQDGQTFYGAHSLSVMVPFVSGNSETLRISRRGRPTVWTGNFEDEPWTAEASPVASAALHVYADPCQWPGSSNTSAPPVAWIENESDGVMTPTNGWRSLWRSWGGIQFPPRAASRWNGSAVLWGDWMAGPGWSYNTTKLVACTSVSRPGRFIRLSNGSWSFEPWGAGVWGTLTNTGWTAPAGDWFALGMCPIPKLIDGRYEDTEGLVGVYLSTGGTFAQVIDPTTGPVGDPVLIYSGSVVSDWAVAGGLIVQNYTLPYDDFDYPSTLLRLMDPLVGASYRALELIGVEVCPGTICPRALGPIPVDTLLPGYPEGIQPQKISGWFALGIETYQDDNGSVVRRGRFLVFDSQLRVVNGELEPHPLVPGTLVRLGDIISEPVPSSAIVARMIRTGDGDRCVGLFGGRGFQVGFQIPRMLERVNLEDLTAQDFLEAAGAALLLSPIPTGAGGVALISRQGGPSYLRDVDGQRGSWFPGEFMPPTRVPVSRAYLNEVRISYTNTLTDQGETVTVAAMQAGGKPLDKDLGAVLFSAPTARAIGAVLVDHFGPVCPALSLTLRENLPAGLSEDLAPPFWAGWQVGGKVAEPGTPGDPTWMWKITRLRPDPDRRTCQLEAVRLPIREVL